MAKIDSLLLLAETLTGSYLRSHKQIHIKSRLAEFIKEYQVPTIPLFTEHSWMRARICKKSEPFEKLGELLYHPDGSPEIGRAHFPGDKVIYGSRGTSVALDEVGATVGDLVQVVQFTPRAGSLMVARLIGEVQTYWNTERVNYGAPVLDSILEKQFSMNEETFKERAYVDSVIAELFRRRYKRPWEYMLTALCAKELTQGVHPLIYPSVENFSCSNIMVPAALFDNYFVVDRTIVVRVTGCYGHGFYSWNIEHSSQTFSETGEITWSDGPAAVANPGAMWQRKD